MVALDSQKRGPLFWSVVPYIGDSVLENDDNDDVNGYNKNSSVLFCAGLPSSLKELYKFHKNNRTKQNNDDNNKKIDRQNSQSTDLSTPFMRKINKYTQKKKKKKSMNSQMFITKNFKNKTIIILGRIKFRGCVRFMIQSSTQLNC